jgi:hypothetical protein
MGVFKMNDEEIEKTLYERSGKILKWENRSPDLANQWIKCSDRMPEKDGRYIVVEDYSTKWVGVCTMRNGIFDMHVRYWQPLPAPPKESEND